jgi:hypothetical protein
VRGERLAADPEGDVRPVQQGEQAAAQAAGLRVADGRRPGAQLDAVLDEGEAAVVVTTGGALERAHGDILPEFQRGREADRVLRDGMHW